MIKGHQDGVAALPESEQYYSAIGRFVVQFSHLEMVLKLWVAESVGIDEKHHDSIMTHDFALLCTIAQKVLPLGMKNGSDQLLRPVLSKFRELNNHRVRIAHGWWLTHGRHPQMFHTSRSKLVSEGFYRSPLEIAALADQVDMLDIQLRDWYRKNKM
jgi:hypothetical protein